MYSEEYGNFIFWKNYVTISLYGHHFEQLTIAAQIPLLLNLFYTDWEEKSDLNFHNIFVECQGHDITNHFSIPKLKPNNNDDFLVRPHQTTNKGLTYKSEPQN